MKATDEIRYFLYTRKSSEDSQRQIASIGDQISSLTKVVEAEKLNLVKSPFSEERSAKDPGRPIFNEMLDRIEKGEANALLCWDIDRLYRNPVDEGRLRWLLQKNVIRVIRTPYRQFYPEDAGLLMGVEGGRATDYVIRLSKNVKRGLTGKAMRGWRPNGGPIGYLNVGIEKGSKTIDIDPVRFELVRKMWDLFLTGSYAVSKIREIATEEWGLLTLQRRKLGGKPLSMSHMYKIFSDPFYYGYFSWKDPDTGEAQMIKGNHRAMITEREYRRAQVLLGKKGKPQPHTREFAFTGLMRCGECDSSVTAEEKNQLICKVCKYKFGYEGKSECPKCKTDIASMSNPVMLHYVYYRCTKKKNRACTQKTIRLEELELQFKKVLSGMTIDPDYLKVALDYLRDLQSNSGAESRSIRASLEEKFAASEQRLVNLNKEYTSPQNTNHELYTPDEFRHQKMEILSEIKKLEEQMGSTKEKLHRDLEVTERVFNFCAFALKNFNTDDLLKKRTIFGTIGSNITLKDRKLSIERLHPYLLIENEMRAQRALFGTLEREKDGSSQGQNRLSHIQIDSLLRG